MVIYRINVNYFMNFLKAKPGGPPLREYKQSMTKHKASPLPGPMKRKLRKLFNCKTNH